MSQEKGDFSDPKLSIELVPKSSHYRNLHNALSREAWKTIRERVYQRAGQKCEICGGQGNRRSVECHEVWEYDDEEKVQRLSRFLALCPDCHAVKHMGRSMIEGDGERALKHLAEINGWSLR